MLFQHSTEGNEIPPNETNTMSVKNHPEFWVIFGENSFSILFEHIRECRDLHDWNLTIRTLEIRHDYDFISHRKELFFTKPVKRMSDIFFMCLTPVLECDRRNPVEHIHKSTRALIASEGKDRDIRTKCCRKSSKQS